MCSIIDKAKRQCKITKKYNNPNNLSLMKIQHQYAVNNGYKNWKDFIDKNGPQK